MKILLVEDQETMRLILRGFLKEYSERLNKITGKEIEKFKSLSLRHAAFLTIEQPIAEATSGEKAITQFKATPFDIVLMDTNLEGKQSGLEAAKEIRQHTTQELLKIYSISDTKQDEKTYEANGFSPNAYIGKNSKEAKNLLFKRLDDALLTSPLLKDHPQAISVIKAVFDKEPVIATNASPSTNDAKQHVSPSADFSGLPAPVPLVMPAATDFSGMPAPIPLVMPAPVPLAMPKSSTLFTAVKPTSVDASTLKQPQPETDQSISKSNKK